MKLFSSLLIFAFGCASSTPPSTVTSGTTSGTTSAPAIPPAGPRPEIANVAMVLKGDLGLTLWLLRIGKPEADEVLLKYSGVDHPWSGHVMRAKKVNAGTGFDYRITQADGEYTTLVERANDWGNGHFFEVYLPGRSPNGDRVGYDEKASKDLSAQDFLTEYLGQKK